MKKRIFSILMVVVMTIALVACGTAQSSPDSEAVETVKEVVETTDAENSEAVSETEQATEAPVSLVADNVAIDGEFGDATGITVEKLDVAECEAFASYITDKTTAQAVYDIGLTDADKNAVQPDGTVNVTITVPDEMIGAEGDNYLVYFINADAFSQVEVVSVTSDTVTFETEHFSVYAVVKFDSNVMSETDFVRNSEEIAENSEAVSTPETSTEENSEAVSEPDSEAVVEPEFTVTEVTATKYATQSVNVRSGPSTDYDKIGSLSTNQEITVNGVCDQTGWFRFDLNGTVAFVSNRYVSDEKLEKPAASETPSNGGGSSGGQASSGQKNWSDFYQDHVWYDMNDFMFIIVDSRAEGQNEIDYENAKAILAERFPGEEVYPRAGGELRDGHWMFFAYVRPRNNGIQAFLPQFQ